MDKATVDNARKEAEEAYTKFALLKDAYSKAEADYIKKVNRFRAFDYELAQSDGRLIKLKPSDSSKKKVQKQPELSLDQLKSIAEKLGVSLTVEDEEEVDDETVDAIMEEEEESHETQV